MAGVEDFHVGRFYEILDRCFKFIVEGATSDFRLLAIAQVSEVTDDSITVQYPSRHSILRVSRGETAHVDLDEEFWMTIPQAISILGRQIEVDNADDPSIWLWKFPDGYIPEELYLHKVKDLVGVPDNVPLQLRYVQVVKVQSVNDETVEIKFPSMESLRKLIPSYRVPRYPEFDLSFQMNAAAAYGEFLGEVVYSDLCYDENFWLNSRGLLVFAADQSP